MIDGHFITTALELEGYRIVRHCGVVRGIVVRSRSAIGNFAAGIQTFFGGNISLYTELCEQARQEAFDLLRQHAFQAGGNAIIGMRYDANDVASGVTEVLAYGTAVVVELQHSSVPDAGRGRAGQGAAGAQANADQPLQGEHDTDSQA